MTDTPNDSFRKRLQALLPASINPACPYAIERGEGPYLFTTDGKRLIDFTTGIAVMNVGHAHPHVTEAITQAAHNSTHFCFQALPYEPYLKLLERLISRMPASDDWKGILFNSGAEAVENAMKIVRYATKRQTIMSFEHAFHGRTLGALSLTSKPMPYRSGFGPFIPETVQIPFPSRYRCSGCGGDCDCTAVTIERIRQVFATRVPAEDVAAIFIEPVVGEGGFYIPPDDFLPALRKLCDQHGILLVVDEIQTGIGRTGTFFRYEASGIVPDLLLTAKALGGGLPLSGIIGKKDILDTIHPGGLGGTYTGNPIALAAAHAVLDIVEKDNLAREAARKGEIVMAAFRRWMKNWDVIGDVRGVGLMCAIEFVKDRQTKEPYKEIIPRIISACYAKGLAALPAGTYSNCIRVLPALNIADNVLEEGLDILESAIAEVLSAEALS